MSAFRWSDHIKHGDSADRPAATDVAEGALYASDDLALLEQVVSGAWETFADLSGAAGLDDSDVAPVAPNAQTGTAYTFALADFARLVTASNAGAITYTIPANASVAFAVGTTLAVLQRGVGAVTFVGDTGVTLHDEPGDHTAAQWSVGTVTKIGTDEWVTGGDVTT